MTETLKAVRSSVIDAVLLQPWFLPKRIADAIVGMVPPGFHKKMRYYFDDYGCMICGRDTRYHSNGMCMVCYCRVLRRLKKSVKRRAPKKPDKRLDLVLFRQQKLAKSLLQDFVPPDKTAAKRLTSREYRPLNPVYEAFSAHRE